MLIWFPSSLCLVAAATAPAPLPPVPSPQQAAWQRDELTMFVHFGVNTYTDREWGDGKEDERLFNPTDLDCRQWARAAREAGFKLMILTAKHHDGFCLWPSAHTEHSVKRSPWRDGRGDVVREFVDACRAEGLKVGLYLSPWDRNSPVYGSDAYNDYFVNQLTELLTGYGPIDEMWFDGANGEGPNGKKQVYDMPRYFAVIRRLMPDALIAIMGPDIRWVGNESGVARVGESSVRGDRWHPAECDVSLRPGWFYHAAEDGRVKTLDHLMDIYFKSVGRNSVLLLNVPPDRRGRFADPDLARLREFGEAVRGLHAGRLVEGVTATAAGQPAPEVLDGDPDTFWAAPEGATTATIELDLGAVRRFNTVGVQEPILFGERVRQYQIEIEQGGAWVPVARGTRIGHRNLHPLGPRQARRLRLVVQQAAATPLISGFAAYLAPVVPRPAPLSLTTHKPVTVSNVHPQNNTYAGVKVVDGDGGTRWATGDDTRACWLEVDLEAMATFDTVEIQEFEPRISQFELLYKMAADEPWRIALTGDKAGRNFRRSFPAVQGRYVRLNILAATNSPTIWEFNLYPPEVEPLRISVIGDSTVADYTSATQAGWGQALREFCGPATTVANWARSGRSSQSFLTEGWWAKTLADLGGVLLLQFGHNDCPGKPAATDPATTFRDNLRRYVTEARAKGALPILITPVARRTFGRDGQLTDILRPYAEAMLAVGAELAVPVIDLHRHSSAVYTELGDAGSGWINCAPDDRTHFSPAGARLWAGWLVEQLRPLDPRLAAGLAAAGEG